MGHWGLRISLALQVAAVLHVRSPHMHRTSWPLMLRLGVRLQTHAASREKQYAAWSQLIRDYCRSHKKFILNVNDDSRSPLFTNAAINRALPSASIVQLLEQLVSEGATATLR